MLTRSYIYKYLILVSVMLLGANALAQVHDRTNSGFLVAAPDRGFAGNEKVREAFATLQNSANAELVFITDERSRPFIEKAVSRLRQNSADNIVVLPLFISRAEAGFRQMQDLITLVEGPVRYAHLFGESYLAVEMLRQRLSLVEAEMNVIVTGYGAEDADAAIELGSDLSRIAGYAMAGRHGADPRIVVWPSSGSEHRESMEAQAITAMETGSGTFTAVVPFHFGSELDSMMSFDSFMAYKLDHELEIYKTEGDEIEFISLWMRREANRVLALEQDSIGIVFHAHGSDFIWNQTMRDAVSELGQEYPLEFAFSMADPPSLRKAVSRLEQRGVRGIVIVRVFGLASSFKSTIDGLIGADVEASVATGMVASHNMHSHHEPSARLRTGAMVVTTGGLEDHELFARALLDRAENLSLDPGNETIILVAHGNGLEEGNDHWLGLLASLVEQMQSMSDHRFRAIRYETWREDWPDKRKERIESVRNMVLEAQKDSGMAIIIPARTTGQGAAAEFLEGLEYKFGEGFAPHPLFPLWVEQQILKGIETIRDSSGE